MCHNFKTYIINVAEQPLVCAVKIAGINVTVAFAHKLMGAMAAHSALLSFIAEIKSYVIIKLPDAYIFSSYKILDSS